MFAKKQNLIFASFCNVCHRRRFFSGTSESFDVQKVCQSCRRPTFNYWKKENDTIPTPLSDFNLPSSITILEELVVSPCLPCINMFTVTGGQSAFSGHSMAIMQDLLQMARYLPRLGPEIATIVFVKRGVDHLTMLCVRRPVVQQILKVLEEHNPVFLELKKDLNTSYNLTRGFRISLETVFFLGLI